MKDYRRLMLGKGSEYAETCFKENFIGLDYGIDQDLTGQLPDDWREFNKKFIPYYLEKNPGKSKIAAGLACGALWVVCRGLGEGDVVICPDGDGNYYIGEITSGYTYKSGEILPHRRGVKWYPVVVERSLFSDAFQKSTARGVIVQVTDYADEIEKLIGSSKPPTLISNDETVEDPSVFALETHLEHFLVQNWNHTLLGKDFEIFEEEGELVGQQFPSDTGPIDILAVSKDKKTLLVIELKKGRASDRVVGQIQRYMGFVKDVLAENGQRVKGVIIALEDDLRIRRALSVTQDISFYRYQINFELYRKL